MPVGKVPFRALTVAGSDSGGGAGIQADLKTFQAVGCYGMSVITALTAQNTQTVKSIFPVSPDFIVAQLDAVIEDIGVDAVKIGMLFSPAIIEAVAERLGKIPNPKIVVDPVMVAKAGSRLLQPDATHALIKTLLPLASVVTPNIPEAEILTASKISNTVDMERAADHLLEHCQVVVLKGGHLETEDTSDLFATRAGLRKWLRYPRVKTPNTHGTGCTYSAAIAGYAAQGLAWEEAVDQARAYLQGAILAGQSMHIGQGHGPVHHHWRFEF
jgi:hydroxymethylpyrimidine/phosphomethylpyrimidine kinase